MPPTLCTSQPFCHPQRDDELIVIEKRNFFSLFCLDLEAQLVHVNLAQIVEIFEQLVSTQVKGHVDVSHYLILHFTLYSRTYACACAVLQYLGLWDSLKATVDEMKTQHSKNPGQSSNYSSPSNSLTTASGELSPRRHTTLKEHAASPFV